MDDPRITQLERSGERDRHGSDPMLVTATVTLTFPCDRHELQGGDDAFVRNRLRVLDATIGSIDGIDVEEDR